jgi:hypothetical protein
MAPYEAYNKIAFRIYGNTEIQTAAPWNSKQVHSNWPTPPPVQNSYNIILPPVGHSNKQRTNETWVAACIICTVWPNYTAMSTDMETYFL